MFDAVEEIKSRLGIVEVVSQYVQLKKAGRSYKGLCPFHSEKSPSFVVSPEKQICHCFGCNKGGDIFSFTQEIEGISFKEAIAILAERAGVKLEKQQKTFSKDEKDEFYQAQKLSAEIFHKELLNTENGKKVREYLYRRGVSDEIIAEFQIGFSPHEYDFLHPQLLKSGISKDTLLKSGLASNPEIGGDRIYDKFRGRLMFPIFNHQGKICGFGGRALSKDQNPKYLNSPDSHIYNKSKILFGFHQAKKHIKEQNSVIMAEGYFDMILPYQNGIKNIVSVSGTALTRDHITIIKRLTPNIITCFDADKAGFEATKRSYFLAANSEINMLCISELEGKDPADFVKQNLAAFKEKISTAKPFISYLIQKITKDLNLNDFNEKHAAIKQILPFLKKTDAISRENYVKELSLIMDVSTSALYEDIEKNTFKNFEENEDIFNKKPKEISQHKPDTAETILAILLEKPQLFPTIQSKLLPEYFNNHARAIYNLIEEKYNSGGGFSGQNGPSESDETSELLKNVRALTLFAEDRYGNFSEVELNSELLKLSDRLTLQSKKLVLAEIKKQVHEAEKLGLNDKVSELLEKQNRLIGKSVTPPPAMP